MNPGYTMTAAELRQLQLVQREMIAEVDRLCRLGGIRYCVVGGTALGAVRHGGYIPWDDDADIGFLRGEYEKFRDLCATELDASRFYFQDHRNTPGYRWGYGKLRRKDTLFVRLGQEDMPYEQGVFIDLFVFDNAPENFALRWLHDKICYAYRKAFWSAVGRHTADGLARWLFKLLYLLPERGLYAWFDRFVDCCARHPSPLVRPLTFPTPLHCFERRWYEELREIDFEGLTLFVADDYEGYLTSMYGDWRKLPPPEQRKAHPISLLKLIEAEALP